MAEPVRIVLQADDDGSAVVKAYGATIQRVAKETEARANQAFAKLSADVGTRLQDLSNTVTSWARRIGVVALPLAGAAAVKVGADFQAAMSRVGSISDASKSQLDALALRARSLSGAVGKTATELAEAERELAQAGFSTDEVLAGIKPVSLLAAAGALDLGQAADYTAGIMRVMGMRATELGHAVDVMTKAAVSSNVEVRDIGESFKFLGPVARALDVRFEEINAALAVLGDRNIKAEMAGTALRRTFSVFLGDVEEGEKGIGAFNVKIRDSQGHFVGLAETLRRLQKAGFNAQDAMSVFGQRAGPAVIALLQAGTHAIDAYEESLKNAGGTAENIAAKNLDNLRGDLSKLGAVFRDVAIEITERLSPQLRGIAQSAITAARSFSEFVASTGFVDGVTRAVKLLALALATVAAVGIAVKVASWVQSLQGLALTVGALDTAFITVAKDMRLLAQLQAVSSVTSLSEAFRAATTSALTLRAAAPAVASSVGAVGAGLQLASRNVALTAGSVGELSARMTMFSQVAAAGTVSKLGQLSRAASQTSGPLFTMTAAAMGAGSAAGTMGEKVAGAGATTGALSGSFLGVVTRMGLFVGAALAVGWQIGRLIGEFTGLDQAVQTFWERLFTPHEETKRQADSIFAEFDLMVKRIGSRRVDVEGFVTPEQIERVKAIRKEIEELQPAADHGMSGARLVITHLVAELQKLAPSLDASASAMARLERRGADLAKKFPEEWKKAGTITTGINERIAMTEDMIRKAAEDAAAAGVRAHEKSAEQLRKEKQAAEELERAFEKIKRASPAGVRTQEQKLLLKVDIAKKIGASDLLVPGLAEELVQFGDMAEKALGKVPAKLKALVDQARLLTEFDKEAKETKEAIEALSPALLEAGIASESMVSDFVKNMARAQKAAQAMGLGSAAAIDAMAEQIVKVVDAAGGLDKVPAELRAAYTEAKRFLQLKADTKTWDDLAGKLASVGVYSKAAADKLEGSLVQELRVLAQHGMGAAEVAKLHRQELLDLGAAAETAKEQLDPLMSVLVAMAEDEKLTAKMQEWNAQWRDMWIGFRDQAISSLGDAIGQLVVFGGKGSKIVGDLIKQLAKQGISMLVQWGIQRLMLHMINQKTGQAEAAQNLSAGLAQVYVNSFQSAAAIPVVGWAMAPGIAAANLAMASGVASAFTVAGAITSGASGGGGGIGGAGGGSGGDFGSDPSGGGFAGGWSSASVPAAEHGALIMGSERGSILRAGERFKDEMILPIRGEPARRAARELGLHTGAGRTTVVEATLQIFGDNWSRGNLSGDLLKALHSGLQDLISRGILPAFATGAA